MPGFFASNRKIECLLDDAFPDKCIREELPDDSNTFKRNTLDKFMLDKAFSVSPAYTCILDGYLLNKKELLQQYKAGETAELLLKMYFEKGDSFINELRGVYSGLINDRQNNRWLIWTNHCGESPLFYMRGEDDAFFVGSEVSYLLNAAREGGIKLTFNESAAYQMITYGYMIDDSTYANEIKRLQGGHYIVVENEKFEIKEYFAPRKDEEIYRNISDDEAIELIDKKFAAAVKLNYEKDVEYGYNHLTDISGGLDSRMNAWMAHELGYKDLQMLSYSKAGYLDEIIAEEIAQYWGDELLFKPLDDIKYLYDIDVNTRMLGGLSFYSGITGGNRMLHSINLDGFGLEHTGMIGDVVIGSFFKNPEDNKNNSITKLYSNKFSDRVSLLTNKIENKYFDHEMFLVWTRGIQGAAITYLLRRNYTEVASPFMDVDFLITCLNLPLHLRCNHYIYKKWIKEKYPDAANFRWEKISGKITEPNWVVFLRRCIMRGPNRIMRFLGKDSEVSFQMNPLDYWVKRNPDFRYFMSSYMNTARSKLDCIIESDQLKEDLITLFNEGNMIEKSMVLTVYSAIKFYFGEKVSA